MRHELPAPVLATCLRRSVWWANQWQTEITDFQNAQMVVLLQKWGKERILLNDNQRRILAVKGRTISRKTLLELTTIAMPDSIPCWHRETK